jgi:hypothetical protein
MLDLLCLNCITVYLNNNLQNEKEALCSNNLLFTINPLFSQILSHFLDIKMFPSAY